MQIVRCAGMTVTELSEAPQFRPDCTGYAHFVAVLARSKPKDDQTAEKGSEEIRGIVFTPPGVSMSLWELEGRQIDIAIAAERFQSLNEASGDVFVSTALFSAADAGTEFQSLVRELRRRSAESSLLVESAVLTLIGRLAGVLRRRSDPVLLRAPLWMRAAETLLARRLYGGVTAEQLAEEIGVAKRDLDAAFKTFHGKIVSELIQDARLERARSELRNTNRSLVDIASAVGFYDHSHFVKTFKKAFGMTPGDYRLRHRR